VLPPLDIQMLRLLSGGNWYALPGTKRPLLPLKPYVAGSSTLILQS